MDQQSAPAAHPARIFIVEDYPIVREGLVQWLHHQPSIIVVGEAGTIPQAREAMATIEFDILLLDLMVNGSDGIEFIKELRAAGNKKKILVLSMHDETVYAQRALRSGANGYVMKQQSTSELLQAIKVVNDGELYMSSKVSILLSRRFVKPDHIKNPVGLETLTDRELHIYQLIGTGISLRQISEHLNISLRTVEAHRENIKNKLGINTASALIHHATSWVNTLSQ